MKSFFQNAAQLFDDEFANEDVGHFITVIQIDSSDQSFKRISENVIFFAATRTFFSLAQIKVYAQIQFRSDLGQIHALHERGTPVREYAFALEWVLPIQIFGDD